jgi:hypothetical protein
MEGMKTEREQWHLKSYSVFHNISQTHNIYLNSYHLCQVQARRIRQWNILSYSSQPHFEWWCYVQHRQRGNQYRLSVLRNSCNTRLYVYKGTTPNYDDLTSRPRQNCYLLLCMLQSPEIQRWKKRNRSWVSRNWTAKKPGRWATCGLRSSLDYWDANLKILQVQGHVKSLKI